jgi:hypothetical protein
MLNSSGCRPPWPSIGTVSEVPNHSGSDESVDFVERCIKHCTTSGKHQFCKVSSNRILPTRLLDVQKDKPIRLCKPSKSNVTTNEAHYLALSHCWGDGPLLTLTESNVAQMYDEIEWDSLPALFQDSIRITRQLGLRFLWIDSLCIMQDSKPDWETESARMSSIYENAYLVCSPVESAHSNVKCLLPRPKKLRLSYHNTTGKEFKLYARKIQNHHPCPEQNSPANPIGPLIDRAWALQESVLATRILHFTSTELIFECRSAVSCECRPSVSYKPTTPGLFAKSLSCKSKSGLYSAWHQIVNQFVLRNISHLSDRLPAISGMAKKFEEVSKSKYLAGIWQDNLAFDMLWSSAPFLENPHVATRTSVYRAPSFSWASVETQVHYEKRDDEIEFSPLIKMIKAESISSGLNPLGEVTGGYIILHAQKVIQGTLIAPSAYEFHYRLKICGHVIDVNPDSLLVKDEVSSGADESQPTVRRAKVGEAYKPFSAPVTCMAISTSSEPCISGLVLGLSPSIPGAYERLGLFTCGNTIFEGGTKKRIKIV